MKLASKEELRTVNLNKKNIEGKFCPIFSLLPNCRKQPLIRFKSLLIAKLLL